MGQLLLFVVVALVVASILFGVTVMLSGNDSGLTPTEADGRSVTLPSDRPLGEEDVVRTTFDTALRGYRMNQVDAALQRAAYDIGYKGELIGVLEAEVTALREGRLADADVLRKAREAAIAPPPAAGPESAPEAARPDVPADGTIVELVPEVPADDPVPTAAETSPAGPVAGRGTAAPSDSGAPVERR